MFLIDRRLMDVISLILHRDRIDPIFITLECLESETDSTNGICPCIIYISCIWKFMFEFREFHRVFSAHMDPTSKESWCISGRDQRSEGKEGIYPWNLYVFVIIGIVIERNFTDTDTHSFTLCITVHPSIRLEGSFAFFFFFFLNY